MSPLQWSLLILGAVIVAGLMVSAWREKKRSQRPREVPEEGGRPRFGRDWEPTDRLNEKGFDEFGVSRARSVGGEGEPEPSSAPGPKPEAEAATVKPSPAPVEDKAVAPKEAASPAEDKDPPSAEHRGKLIAFYIAEHEGTAILGPKIHQALNAHGLEFGAKKIYHRLRSGRPVFGVASLTKPGTLDPSDADGFSTPGLSVFMQLPGPTPPVEAFSDMVTTAKALARDLKAEVFDTEQQEVLTPERERELRQQVREFAHQSGM